MDSHEIVDFPFQFLPQGVDTRTTIAKRREIAQIVMTEGS
jgi:hypothetical protein